VLEVLLALDGDSWIVVFFEVYELPNSVATREARNLMCAVLKDPAHEIVRDADIQRSSLFLLQRMYTQYDTPQQCRLLMPGSSPGMTCVGGPSRTRPPHVLGSV
jgi:hypothetical protein